jgi:hypothetical protein
MLLAYFDKNPWDPEVGFAAYRRQCRDVCGRQMLEFGDLCPHAITAAVLTVSAKPSTRRSVIAYIFSAVATVL